MADNVPITAGSGTSIATDEVAVNGGSVAHVEFVKLVDGTSNGVDGLPGSAARGLQVDPRSKAVRLAQTPTVSTSPAYTAKDAIGGLLTFSNAVRSSGGSCVLQAVQIVDKGQQMSALDLLLFDATITAPTDNAIFNPSDSELTHCVGVVQLINSDYADLSTNSVASRLGLGLEIVLAGTDLFGVLVARGTPTYTATTDIVVTLTILQD